MMGHYHNAIIPFASITASQVSVSWPYAKRDPGHKLAFDVICVLNPRQLKPTAGVNYLQKG